MSCPRDGRRVNSIRFALYEALSADPFPAVITSEARQSMPRRAGPWIAASLALLAMTTERDKQMFFLSCLKDRS
jgi:hypothetical protein